MTSDTITPSRVADLEITLSMSLDRVRVMIAEINDGDITPIDAAASINEILANINAVAQ